jgi:hypothetical protein
MPCLAQLARFRDGGCVITTIVVAFGVYGRRRGHILHMRTVLVSQRYACTGLQGHYDA